MLARETETHPSSIDEVNKKERQISYYSIIFHKKIESELKEILQGHLEIILIIVSDNVSSLEIRYNIIREICNSRTGHGERNRFAECANRLVR